MFSLKTVTLYLILGLIPSSLFARQIGSDIYQNKDFKNAERWLQNNNYIRDSLIAYHVPPDGAIAIVFPELMRYSALRDKMEVTGLMVLYTRLGKDYADFSVGHFQMKPSFVQQLESDARKYLTKKTIHRICPFLLNSEDKQDTRRKRVNSLTSVRNEVSYLALFYKICLKRFKDLHFNSEAEKIRFLATAYNCGYHHSVKNLFAQMKKKQFPVYNGLLISHINYANLALKWWNEKKQEQKETWPQNKRASIGVRRF